uniref:Reverse transcriptase domain-containing protein n=1 Tax=Tanacetum cinerariifolium TaxID=118510 RepID=A0A699HFJ0_TANCI|nr:reverse transcriptase domain-containing protein [Tanacetum cinerariifolium]
MDEMISVTTAFLRREVAASNLERKKSFSSWKQKVRQQQNFKRGNFQNEQKTKRKQDRFTLLTKTPKEILTLDKGKFKPPPPMTTPVEKKNASKFCELHREVGHTTDECMHLKRQIKEMLKDRKLSYLMKELKQNHKKDQAKTAKKGETSGKDKSLAILMVQPWQRISRQRITQTFFLESIISFPTLREEDGTKGPMIIEAEMGGHSHGMIKFSEAGGIVTLRSSRIIPLECSMVLEPGIPRPVINQVTEEKIQVAIHLKYLEQTIAIDATLTGEGRKELCGLLRRHLDVFAWKPTDMTGVPWYIAEHRLNVHEGCLPVRQKKRGQAPERNKAISEEVKKDVEETFKKLREINMKLNPKKCAFGMREGTFLGYKVDADSLRVSSEKVEAVLDLPSPKCLKDVQKMNGKLASLHIFLSKSAEKSLPFFKMLKKCIKKSDFQWTAEAEVAFKEMKQLIDELPMLTTPKEKKELIMYLAAVKEAISAFMMTERDGKQVTVRLLKWRCKLGEHDIKYRPKTSVKGQILADFIVERPEDDTPNTSIEEREELPDPWILFTNGSSCIDGFGADLIITNPKGMEFTYALRFKFNATNNEAEYEALIAGLRIARQIGVQNLQANVDSKLVANQVNGIYVAKEGENKKANVLRKIASASFTHLSKQVLVEELKEKVINEKEILAVIEEEGHTWMTPVYEYLMEGILPEEKRKQGLSLREGIKAWLEDKNKNLVEEISHVLWAHRTMIKSSNEETSFSLTYGAEAVILAEIGMPTLRTAKIDIVKNNEALEISLDLLEEKREQAAVQEARSKAKMERYYNARVQNTSFQPRDFVYRNNEASHAKDGGKFRPKWEGPYEVTEALGKGAYKISDRDGHIFSRTWNICNLNKCYMHKM